MSEAREDEDIERIAAALPDGEYAIVELLGHRTLIGRIAEVERFGTKLLQIEPVICDELLAPVYHHGSSIYCLTPCEKHTIARCAPKRIAQLPSPIRARMLPARLAPPASDEAEPDA